MLLTASCCPKPKKKRWTKLLDNEKPHGERDQMKSYPAIRHE